MHALLKRSWKEPLRIACMWKDVYWNMNTNNSVIPFSTGCGEPARAMLSPQYGISKKFSFFRRSVLVGSGLQNFVLSQHAHKNAEIRYRLSWVCVCVCTRSFISIWPQRTLSRKGRPTSDQILSATNFFCRPWNWDPNAYLHHSISHIDSRRDYTSLPFTARELFSTRWTATTWLRFTRWSLVGLTQRPPVTRRHRAHLAYNQWGKISVALKFLILQLAPRPSFILSSPKLRSNLTPLALAYSPVLYDPAYNAT